MNNPTMTTDELNTLDTLLTEAGVMTTGDLLDKLSYDTRQAIQSDLIAAQPKTAEELAYFDAENDLSTALDKAHQAATKALDSQDAVDLADAAFAFECAATAARTFAQAMFVRDAAFKLSDEYRAQLLAKGESE